nr:reverse transcriptase domain-containing protein [Tanacetum cinerariifolium]
MVKKGIFLGHKISKNEIEVDKAKVDVIAKLPHSTTVKGIRSFLGHADFYQRFIQDFSKIAQLMTHLLENYTSFFFSKECAVVGQRQENHFRPIDYAIKTMTEEKLNYTTMEKEMFGTPRTIISDRGTHFCYDQFAKVMLKYGVSHRLATPYHPQTSGQVEVSNRSLKRILERTMGENRAFWSDKLDDALWAFQKAYKTPIGCTQYKLVYGKACHQSIELKHKAYWALMFRFQEKTKRLHDSKIKDCVFNIGDRVLLFNSRLNIFSGKLKTRWSGPFTITHVFPYSTVELSQINGPNFKVNGHKLKHYFGEDIPKIVVPDLQTFPKDQGILGLGQAK